MWCQWNLNQAHLIASHMPFLRHHPVSPGELCFGLLILESPGFNKIFFFGGGGRSFLRISVPQDEPGEHFRKWKLSSSPQSRRLTSEQAGYWFFRKNRGRGCPERWGPWRMGHVPVSWGLCFFKPLGVFTDKRPCWKCPSLLCCIPRLLPTPWRSLRSSPHAPPEPPHRGTDPSSPASTGPAVLRLWHSECSDRGFLGLSSLHWYLSRQDLSLHLFSSPVWSTVPSSIKFKQTFIKPLPGQEGHMPG